MAIMSSGECQWAHWVSGVTERPWTFGVEVVSGVEDIVPWIGMVVFPRGGS